MEQPADHERVVIGGRAMRRRLLAGALALAATAAGASALAPRSVAKPGPPPQVFAFLSHAGGAELQHLRRYGPRISVLAPNWYTLTFRPPALSGAPSPTVVTMARAAGDRLWPVVNGIFAADGEIATAAARERIAGMIAGEAAARGYDGITLDLEQLPPSETRAFVRLVALVAARLHARNQRLAVYVPRHAGSGAAYDWAGLSRVADLLIASGYNEHAASSRPGPVATAQGFAGMLDYAAGVSRQRVAPAIGAFGYSWPRRGGDGEMLSTLSAQTLLAQAGARLHDPGGDAWFLAGGGIVHYETGDALVARARAARAAGMRWLALFSLGREPNAFWNGITTARQTAAPVR